MLLWERGAGLWLVVEQAGWPEEASVAVVASRGGHFVATLGTWGAASGLRSRRGKDLGAFAQSSHPVALLTVLSQESRVPGRRRGGGSVQVPGGGEGGQYRAGGARAAVDTSRQTQKGRDSLYFTFCLTFGPDRP